LSTLLPFLEEQLRARESAGLIRRRLARDGAQQPEQEVRRMDVARLAGMCRAVMMHRAGLTLIEGAGGWRVPVNPRQFLSDLAKVLDIPVVLVVGIRLGCINHALLTAQAVHLDGVRLAGLPM
jgi:dethiobiotin synthase